MQNNLNITASEVISTYVYKIGLQQQQYSYSAAIGLFNTVINLVLLIIVNKASDKMSGNSLCRRKLNMKKRKLQYENKTCKALQGRCDLRYGHLHHPDADPVYCGYPLYWVIISSFSDPTAVSAGKVLLSPIGFTLKGYAEVFKNSQVMRGFFNSIVITFVGVCVNLAVTLPTAYALSRDNFSGKKTDYRILHDHHVLRRRNDPDLPGC